MPATARKSKKERELLRKLKDIRERARETDRRLEESLRRTDDLIRWLQARKR